MEQPIQPIVPEGTPLPPAPVGVPPYPITPFAVWTWSTPVIPEFYWNIYSSEQRIKQICKEIGKIESYLNYLANKTNENIIELHKRIDQLTERVAQLERHVEEEVARLDALIAQLRADLEQEISDRQEADEALGERIDQEILDRTHGDQALHQEIADEATARTHADDQLHSEISTETQDRIHADDALHAEISTETQNRIHADDELHEEITQRLLPTDVQAGAEIEITRPDPNSNTIVIASTVAHSISELASTVSGLQAALTSETEERRADDAALWTAVNERIERGKILAGRGIRVVNDPDASTVTIYATGSGGSTTVTGTAPVEVTGTPEEGYTVGVSEATEEEPGVITETRVKELAPKINLNSNPSASVNRASNSIRQNISFEDPETSELSIARNISMGPITPVPSGLYEVTGSGLVFKVDGGSTTGTRTVLGVKTGLGLEINGTGEVIAKPATESAQGIISEARVKELAAEEAGPSLSAEAPLKIEDGTISLTKDPAGPVTSSSAGLSVREITPQTSSESETGVVSKATIKSLATFSGGVNDNYGLTSQYSGGLRVKASPEVFGFNGSGEIALSSKHVRSGEFDRNLPAAYLLDRSGKPDSVTDFSMTGTMDRVTKFWLVNADFMVKESSSSDWKYATPGTFEAFVTANSTDGHLYYRCTPYGATYYAGSNASDKDSWSIVAVKIIYTVLGLPIEASAE